MTTSSGFGFSGKNTVQGVLRIEFSKEVSQENLSILHSSGLEGDISKELKDLLYSARTKKISSVYKLSKKEISDENNPFIREFVLNLSPGFSSEHASKILIDSPLIKGVKPVSIKKIFP